MVNIVGKVVATNSPERLSINSPACFSIKISLSNSGSSIEDIEVLGLDGELIMSLILALAAMLVLKLAQHVETPFNAGINLATNITIK